MVKLVQAKPLTIAEEYYDVLKSRGLCVPRDKKTGETLTLVVGKTYLVSKADCTESILAYCTQDMPCALAKENKE